MKQRPERCEYADFYANYVALVPAEGELVSLYRSQSEEMVSYFSALSEEQGNYRYAPEKWSVKQLIGHLTDSGRIMSYRLLHVARGDRAPLPPFKEEDYVQAGNFDSYSLQELLEHYSLVRQSTLALLGSLPDEAWARTGTVSQAPLSARAQACILIGHELHHLKVLKERYFA